MRTCLLIVTPIAALFLLVSASRAEASHSTPHEYVAPLTGSQDVSPLNNTDIRDGRTLDRAALGRTPLLLRGPTCGSLAGRLGFSDDGNTVAFTSHRPSSPDGIVVGNMERGPPQRRLTLMR
jgi:hypothetical protein